MEDADKKLPLSKKLLVLVYRFMFAISRKHKRNDIQIADFPLQKDYLLAFSKIDKALDMISKFDPHRFSQITCDVKRIWVSAIPGSSAEWVNEVQMCVIDRNYLLRDDVTIPEIAQTIVHEATHARLFKLDIEYTEELRHRIERICIEAEIAFARRLPDNQKLIEIAHAQLQIPQSYWTNAEFKQRNLDTLAELGKKSWFVHLLYPFTKRIVDKRAARAARKSKG